MGEGVPVLARLETRRGNCGQHWNAATQRMNEWERFPPSLSLSVSLCSYRVALNGQLTETIIIVCFDTTELQSTTATWCSQPRLARAGEGVSSGIPSLTKDQSTQGLRNAEKLSTYENNKHGSFCSY